MQIYLIANICFKCYSSSHVSDAPAHCQDGCPCQAYAHRPCHFHLCEGNNTKYFLPLCLTYVSGHIQDSELQNSVLSWRKGKHSSKAQQVIWGRPAQLHKVASDKIIWLIYTISHLLYLTFKHLHVLTITHSHIYTFSHLRILTFTHSHIYTFSQFHILTLTFTLSHVNTFSQSLIWIFSAKRWARPLYSIVKSLGALTVWNSC